MSSLSRGPTLADGRAVRAVSERQGLQSGRGLELALEAVLPVGTPLLAVGGHTGREYEVSPDHLVQGDPSAVSEEKGDECAANSSDDRVGVVPHGAVDVSPDPGR